MKGKVRGICRILGRKSQPTYPLDIFFTQRYEYTLEEDADIAASQLLSTLSGPGFRGTILAENGFRLDHPWRIVPFSRRGTHLAYLSGSIDYLPPLKLPSPEPAGDPVYIPRATIDVRIRPNLLLVFITYLTTLLLGLDLLGIELFWRTNYLLRLGAITAVEIGSIWLMFRVCANLKTRFETALGFV
jgi:hypothetical protein